LLGEGLGLVSGERNHENQSVWGGVWLFSERYFSVFFAKS
jgi:hypothetical protein